MKRIAMVMLLMSALTALAKFSPIGVHSGQTVAHDDSGDSGDDSGDEDSGT